MADRILLKRLYKEHSPSDGTRILVDGLWPRGVPKRDWPASTWRPDLAPTRELREWYRHVPERFDEFRQRYTTELEDNTAVNEILEIEGTVTLITATKDVKRSHAYVLRGFLESRL